MNQAANDANAIPCMVLTFTPKELSYVNSVLETDGYEGNLKQWILDTMNCDESPGESRYAGAADRVINNVSDFVQENPDTIRAASALAGSFLRQVIKKGPQQ